MKEPKLIQYLKACSSEEIIRFTQFVHSRYHNTDEQLVRLLAHLAVFHPDLPPESYTKQRLHQAVAPAAGFNEKKVRYWMSDLCQLIERFWAIEHFVHDRPVYQLSLLEELSSRKQTKGYQQLKRRWQQQKPVSTVNSLYHEYRFKALEQEHFLRLRVRQFDDKIQQAAEALDRFYFLAQLVYACGMLDRQQILQGDYQLSLSPAWLSHLQSQAFFAEPLIQLYFIIFQMLREESNSGHFVQLKEQLLHNDQLRPSDTLRDAYLLAINYCARKIREGQVDFLAEALGLYEVGIERAILFDDGELSPWTFTNVVKLALRLERYDWIETFIDRYGQLLPDQFRDNALHYNRAELYYYTSRYGKAQLELNQVAFSDLNYYLGARVLLAKVYFETEEIEPLLSLIAAFMIFLKRNREISANIKQTYLNFCQFLFQITKNKPGKRAPLRARIEETSLLTDRDWLLKQLKD